MQKKRAFLHHYLANGMEESQFIEARAGLEELQKYYNEVIMEVSEEEGEEEGI